MKAVDRLRNIARGSSDQAVLFKIEMWIAEHCLELSNTFALGLEDQSRDGAIKHHSKKSLMMLAEKIIDEAPLVQDIYFTGSPIKKFTRTVCVLREQP